jgi:hypothetical protein
MSEWARICEKERRARTAATLLAGMLSFQGEYVGMVENAVRMTDELLAELDSTDSAKEAADER